MIGALYLLNPLPEFETCRKRQIGRRSTQMNADKLFAFNRRLSAFIGGWIIFGVLSR